MPVGELTRAVSPDVLSGGAATAEVDLAALEELVDFEGDDLDAGEHLACLAEPWVTATTRILCDR